MGGKKRNKVESKIFGTFVLDNIGSAVLGEVSIKGESTAVVLYSDYLSDIVDGSSIRGKTVDRKFVTCIDCVGSGLQETMHADGESFCRLSIFPHYVAIGNQHIDEKELSIRRIFFRTDDLAAIFYDFEAFQTAYGNDVIAKLENVQPNNQEQTDATRFPAAVYFKGEPIASKIETEIGTFSVQHVPLFHGRGPEGILLENRMLVSLEPKTPINFSDAMQRLSQVSEFLSLVAGRTQEVTGIALETTSSPPNAAQRISVYRSFSWKRAKKFIDLHKPRAHDLPLDAIRRADEFAEVFSNWIKRDGEWRYSRIRYAECLRSQNNYGVNRIVAAANMFDILPQDATVSVPGVDREVEAAKDQCVEILKALPVSFDRNSALSALGRMGKPSLPKKVQYRTSIVVRALGSFFEELGVVTSTAVKCRNYFVHGGNAEFDYSKIEHLTPFLTDSLEFVFAAADLIESGWDAARWIGNCHLHGHSFARFMSSYPLALRDLKGALGIV